MSEVLKNEDAEELRSAEPHRYKRTPQGELVLYVLRTPGRRDPGPAVIYFSGGAWQRGGPDAHVSNAAWLRDRGAVGICADYRVRDRHGTTPIECVKDAKSAVRYVRAHAAALGVDPTRVVVAGGSAGGHIAACTALPGVEEAGEDLRVSSRADALLLHNPVTGGPGFGRAFFDAHPEANPMRGIAPGWPPTIVSCGTADDVTPHADAVAFCDAVRAVGSPVELIPVPGAGHSCDWPAENPAFGIVMTRMTTFLRAQGLLR